MTLSEYTLGNAPFHERPDCPERSTLMHLALIEPEKPDSDIRKFECPLCEHVETIVVKFVLVAVGIVGEIFNGRYADHGGTGLCNQHKDYNHDNNNDRDLVCTNLQALSV